MNKKVLMPFLFLALFSFNSGFSQVGSVKEKNADTLKVEKKYNRWSIDVNGGFAKPYSPFSPKHYVNTFNLFHVDLGGRYMFNTKFGVRLDFGYDQYESGSNNFNFKGQHMRTNLQGVVNLGRVLNFEDWTQKLNVQPHAGVGYGIIKNDAYKGSDNTLNALLGMTGQLKLTEKIALTGDLTMIKTVRQSYTFDGKLDNSSATKGTIYNATLGLSIYLGKNEKHADWYVEQKEDKEKLQVMQDRVGQLETLMNDADSDGVADYLDAEPNSIPGVAVDSKGRTVDANKNNVPDELESYLNKTYGEGSNGSSLLGTQNTIKELIDGGYVNIYFDTNSIQPTASSVAGMDYIVKYLRANPAAKAEVIGYADQTGNSEHNQKLSVERAENVKNILVKSGIAGERLSTKGNGVDTSSSKDSKEALNIVRRVTFKIK